jgi:hypothetical protein
MRADGDEIPRPEDHMLGSVPGAAALGRWPLPTGDFSRHDYHHAGRRLRVLPGASAR